MYKQLYFTFTPSNLLYQLPLPPSLIHSLWNLKIDIRCLKESFCLSHSMEQTKPTAPVLTRQDWGDVGGHLYLWHITDCQREVMNIPLTLSNNLQSWQKSAWQYVNPQNEDACSQQLNSSDLRSVERVGGACEPSAAPCLIYTHRPEKELNCRIFRSQWWWRRKT